MPFSFDNGARGWTPMIRITIDGREVAGAFYSALIRGTFRDEAGQTSDMATFELDDARNELAVPRDKARIEVDLGYRETGLVRRGVYELQSVQCEGDADEGEKLVLQAKAADLRHALKGVGRKAYSDTTFGQIVRDVARREGLDAVVDPALDTIPIEYDVVLEQSGIDFLTRIGDDFDAVIKPANGKLIAAKRGAARSVSGEALAPIIIRKSDCKSWSIAPDGRVAYGEVKAAWIDQRTGRRRTENYSTGLEGPTFVLPDAYTDQERARKAAEAEGRHLTRSTGDGQFVLFGRPDAQAEATVIPQGFRPEISRPWRAHSVEDVFDDQGYLTTITVKAPEKGGDETAE